MITFDLYTVEEYPDTTEGKFGGYKCTPRLEEIKGRRTPSLYKLNVPLKYDANKGLDKIISNNGINKT